MAAKEGKDCIPLPRPFKGEKTYNFSYSGIKTAVINYAHNCEQKGIEMNKADVAASFQARAVGMLIENAVKAALEKEEKTIVIAGGVAANTALREGMQKAAQKYGIKVMLPPKKLCTDNAAMIGEAAFFAIKEGLHAALLDLDADPNL